ncbi:MAG: non-canonical purine NTP pyrophosphatase [Candidatus Levyibacteriota bacterium]
MSFIEIQADSLEEIALDKAEQASQIINDPFIVSDTGWEIPALRGFPGIYMHYVNEWFTPQDFLNLIKPYKDRSVIIKQSICYRDQKQTKTFSFERKGIILEESRGKGRSGDMIFSFRADKKSIAECRNDKVYYMDATETVWDEFAQWYLQNKPHS